MPDSQHVLTVVNDGVATVTLNRPEVLNALNDELAKALHEALQAAAADEQARCVVINGAGDNFMAGGDLQFFRQRLPEIRATKGRDLTAMFEHVHGTIRVIREMPKPVVASVRGAAAGFGLSLMLCCDLVVAAESSVFTLAYCHIGASPDGGSTYFLPRVLGMKRAFEIALLGERFDAQRAAELGLVNRVVADDELQQATDELAGALVKGPAAAYAKTKALLNGSLGAQLGEQLDLERDAFVAGAQGEDFAEGVSAFCEKRKPRFA
jgi:2-(1,2-epoxy-1,2-dihydrophenyl)acetyl-CoA isomerase